MALKIKNGKNYWIIPIQAYGTVLKIRQDSDGEALIDLVLSDGDTYLARTMELSKTQ